jgi:hypothetical protein
VGTGLRYQPVSEQALRPVPQKKDFFDLFLLGMKISPASEQALRPVPQKKIFFDLFLVGGIVAHSPIICQILWSFSAYLIIQITAKIKYESLPLKCRP